jgi:hypothetical protein
MAMPAVSGASSKIALIRRARPAHWDRLHLPEATFANCSKRRVATRSSSGTRASISSIV